MKKITLTPILVLCSLWVFAQNTEFGIRSLPQLPNNNIEKIFTGDLDQFGHLIFSVTEDSSPIGLWEYIVQGTDDAIEFLLDQPSIVDLVAYQSQYGEMNRLIYLLHWDFGTSDSYLSRYSSTGLFRNHIKFNQLMYGLEVSNVLNFGDVVVWGQKATGELFDLYGNLTGQTRNGVVHGLLNDPDGLNYLAWTDELGDIPGQQFCAIYQYLDTVRLIGGFGPENGGGYADRLYSADGTSAFLDELPQPEEAEYSWMGVVPYVGSGQGATRFMAAAKVIENGQEDYQLLLWNEFLTDYEVYHSFGDNFPGSFKTHAYIVDENNNDALVLGGDDIDLQSVGFPMDHSGLIVLNSAEWWPLEEILGYTFLDNSDGIPDVRVLEYDKEQGYLWVAGKEIVGKDNAGEEILAGFIVTIAEMEGNLFSQETSTSASEELIEKYQTEVFPNPTTESVTIRANVPIKRVRVFTLQGQLITSEQMMQEMTTLNLGGYPAGSYILQIETEEGQAHQKIQKH